MAALFCRKGAVNKDMCEKLWKAATAAKTEQQNQKPQISLASHFAWSKSTVFHYYYFTRAILFADE